MPRKFQFYWQRKGSFRFSCLLWNVHNLLGGPRGALWAGIMRLGGWKMIQECSMGGIRASFKVPHCIFFRMGRSLYDLKVVCDIYRNVVQSIQLSCTMKLHKMCLQFTCHIFCLSYHFILCFIEMVSSVTFLCMLNWNSYSPLTSLQ